MAFRCLYRLRLLTRLQTDKTASAVMTMSHGSTTWIRLMLDISPPTGMGAIEVVVVVVVAGPPGSVTLPLASAVKVNVIMVRVESSEADGY